MKRSHAGNVKTFQSVQKKNESEEDEDFEDNFESDEEISGDENAEDSSDDMDESDDSDEDSAFGLEDEDHLSIENQENVFPSTSQQNIGEPPAKVSKKNKKGLYKPPTSEELSQLKETENLYHSSIFRLQITELLKEVKVQEKRRKQIEAAFCRVKEVLQGLPSSKVTDIQSTKIKGVTTPLIEIPKNVKGKFHFASPSDIKMAGSFVADLCVKPHVTLDIAVTMPKECLQAKDYLNQRYLRKRALYLSYMAKHLKNIDEMKDIKFTYHHGNHYKPILVLQFKGEHGKPVPVHIHVIPEEGYFKLGRFHINKNNIRKEWYEGKAEARDDDAETIQPATPVYNNVVIQDLVFNQTNDSYLKEFQDLPMIREGIALLKVWLRQRQIDVGYGGFSGFLMTMYVVYLLSQRKLYKSMSSYQIMRSTLVSLSKSDWTTNGITLCFDTEDPQRPLLTDFNERFDVVFVDSTGYLNLCADMNKACYERVKHEANLVIQMLDSSNADNFSMLFMTPLSFYRKFDQVIHIKNLEVLKNAVQKHTLEDRLMDFGGHYINTMTPKLISVLQQALQNRVHLLHVQQECSPLWSITDSPPFCTGKEKLTVGLLLNPETCMSVLDKGPRADCAEAQDFRKFWGEKSELRRFIDGSVCEAVLWMDSNSNAAQKRRACSKVAEHILKRHFGFDKKSLTFIVRQLDPLLHLPVELEDSTVPYGTGEEQHVNLMKAFDNLRKLLSNLSDLPLKINSVQGSSAGLRFSEVFPALPLGGYATDKMGHKRYLPSEDAAPEYTKIHHVVCLLEGSGKWPDDKDAFIRMKAAFHINLGEVLSNGHNLPVQVFPGYVDVLKDNYMFRIELAYLREIALTKMEKSNLGQVSWKDTEESLQLEKRIQHLPVLTSLLHGVQQLHNTYSGAVRLAKRWMSAQLLSDHFPDEAIELLVAYVYLSPYPFTVPNSQVTGFLRFLYLLSSHDWNNSPLLVNLNNEFKNEDIVEVQTRYSKERSTLPVMFISTPNDKMSSHWTKKSPTAPILQRVIVLGRESLAVLENQMLSAINEPQDFKQIFRPPLDMFDIVITLYTRNVSRRQESVDVVKESQTRKPRCDNTKLPVYDYEPVQLYLQELREAFDEYALFFYDKYGGKQIGVLWKPQSLCKKDFKVTNVTARMPESIQTTKGKNVHLIPNWEAIIEDFKIIGDGLVKNVDIKTQKWDV